MPVFPGHNLQKQTQGFLTSAFDVRCGSADRNIVVARFLLGQVRSAESKEDLGMKNVWRLIVPTLASLVLLFAAAVSAEPTITTSTPHLSLGAQAAAQTQSVSGTIAAVGKDSFTLTVASFGQAPNAGKSMIFMVDPNTTVEGKLKVGSNADVTYREEKGQNIAVSVRVSP